MNPLWGALIIPGGILMAVTMPAEWIIGLFVAVFLLHWVLAMIAPWLVDVAHYYQRREFEASTRQLRQTCEEQRRLLDDMDKLDMDKLKEWP